MLKGKKIKYKGVEYPSLAALSDAYNMKAETVQYRLNKGWSLEDALTVPLSRVRFEYDGVKYNSLKEFSDDYELPYSILSHHYNRTMDINLALEKTFVSMAKEKPVLWGNKYESYQDIATAYGISVSRLIRSVQKGNKIENVVMDLLENSTVTFMGKEYNGIRDICAEYSVQPINIYNRMLYGMDLLTAITKPIRNADYGNKIEYRERSYTSEVSLCREYGLSVGMIREQLRNHSSLSFKDMFDVFVHLKEHCNLPKDTQVNVIPYCIINGKIYNMLTDFSNECDITASSILSFKCRNNIDDLIDTLKILQSKTVPRYIMNGKLYASKELKAMGYSTPIIKKFEKTYIPMYSGLQKFDFDYECYDVRGLYFKYLSEAESLAMEQSENDDFECDDNEDEEFTMTM